jgi:hypothetical protein
VRSWFQYPTNPRWWQSRTETRFASAVLVGLGMCMTPMMIVGGFFILRDDVYPKLDAWLSAPPAPLACEYRLVPQRDGTILAYRC